MDNQWIQFALNPNAEIPEALSVALVNLIAIFNLRGTCFHYKIFLYLSAKFPKSLWGNSAVNRPRWVHLEEPLRCLPRATTVLSLPSPLVSPPVLWAASFTFFSVLLTLPQLQWHRKTRPLPPCARNARGHNRVSGSPGEAADETD